jgi:hypothetical protein
MTQRYDEMRVAPDAAAAEELRQRLHARLANAAGSDDVRADEVVHLEEIAVLDDASPTDRVHRPLVAAAVIVVVVGASVAFAIRNSANNDSAPVVTPGTTTPATARSGEKIRVTRDSIQLDENLVYPGVVRIGDRTFVLAGRSQGRLDSLRDPEVAILAAFNRAGVEEWRIELEGAPTAPFVVAGHIWVHHRDGTLSRIDPSNGRVIDADIAVNIQNVAGVGGALGWLWAMTGDVADPAAGPPRLVRIDPDDMSMRSVDLPAGVASGNSPDGPKPGAGAMWVPLKQGGVAVIDADTLEMTVIGRDTIGHDVTRVAFDGDVAYLASDDEVSSVIEGAVRATTALGGISYLGKIDGVFGALLRDGTRFEVLRANDPIVVEHRQLAETMLGVDQIDGEAWTGTGDDRGLRRAQLR